MGEPVIYHGTPMTPRDALVSVCTGRAMCVSFYRPDDVEVVEAISPAVMFRQRSVLVLASRDARRAGVERGAGLAALLRLVGAEAVSSGAMGDHARHAGRSVPAQRCAAERLAFWRERSAGLAHGRAARKAAETMREILARLPRLDWPEGRIARLPCAHGGSGQGARLPLARPAHAAGDGGGVRLPLRQRGQHQPCTERVAL